MNKEKTTKYIIYAVLGVLLIACAVFVLRPTAPESKLTANIQVGSQIVLSIPLDLSDDQTVDIAEATGLPVKFEIKEHAIRFSHSDCPDKVCVNTGYLSRDLDIASCLPNRVILTVEAVE